MWSVRHRREHRRVKVRDGARVLECADALDALLAADARLLHAAEGRAQVEAVGAVVVDPDVTADHLAADAVRGYRTLDLQVTKNFTLPGSTALQLRLDALNALNTRNYAFLFDGYPGRPYYYTDGDIAGVTRTIKLTVSVKR